MAGRNAASEVGEEDGMADAQVIDGTAIAAELRRHVADSAARLLHEAGLTPGLATILVGDDPASRLYVRSKARACAAAGIASFECRLPAETAQAALIGEVERLNCDDRV